DREARVREHRPDHRCGVERTAAHVHRASAAARGGEQRGERDADAALAPRQPFAPRVHARPRRAFAFAAPSGAFFAAGAAAGLGAVAAGFAFGEAATIVSKPIAAWFVAGMLGALASTLRSPSAAVGSTAIVTKYTLPPACGTDCVPVTVIATPPS